MATKKTPQSAGDEAGTTTPADTLALKRGRYTVHAPDYLGGVAVTLRAGEVLPPQLQRHIPAADLADLFAPLAAA